MQVKIGNTPTKVFQDADWALLLGAVPRAKGEEHTTLLRPRAESLALCCHPQSDSACSIKTLIQCRCTAERVA